MTEPPSQTVKSPAPLARSWRAAALALSGLLLLAGIGFIALRGAATPVPPSLPAGIQEEVVAQAIAAERDAVVRDPYSGVHWGRLAEVLIANGYAGEAETCLYEAEKRDPHEPKWPYLLGLQRLRYDRAEALLHLRQAVRCVEATDSADMTAPLALAETLMENGNTAEAQSFCDWVLARQPNNARAQLLRGMLSIANDDVAGGITFLAQAARNAAAQKRAYVQLAIAYGRLGDDEIARDYSRQAQHLPPAPDWPDPIRAEVAGLTRGRQAQQQEADRQKIQNQTEERIRLLRGLADESPDARVLVDLAMALNDRGDHRAAEAALREALRREPARFNAHFLLAITLFEQAEVLAKDAATADGATAEYRRAVDAARTTTRMHPGRAPAYYLLGRALHRLHEYPDAAVALEEAVRLRPQELAFRIELARVLADNGQLRLAITQLEQAQTSVADTARLRDTLTALRKRGTP